MGNVFAFLQSPIALIGLRYAGARRRSQLVSFISAISILGMTLGVSLLVLVLSVMNGFDRELRNNILGLMPQGAVYHRYGIEDWPKLQKEFLAKPGVAGAAPFVQLQSLLSHGKNVAPVNLYGVDIEQEKQVSVLPARLAPGVVAGLSENRANIAIGTGLAKTLGVVEGDRLTLVVPASQPQSRTPKVRIFTVLGIFDTGTEVDNGLALVNLAQAQSMSSTPDRVSGMRLRLHELFAAPNIVAELVRALPYGYYGSDWTRSHGNLFQAIQMSKNLVGLLLFLIIAIAAFNVVSTLIMVVVDKQGDIAILRTLGASSGMIMGIFMVQGSLIGLIGTGLGLLVGCLLCAVVPGAFQAFESLFEVQFLKADVYPISYLPVDLRMSDLLLIATVALVMSFVATVYPAWRASRVEPAEALRYE